MEFIPSTYASLGLLGGLCTALALRMSFYRLAGSPGEAKPNSPLNVLSEVQLLTAEWAPLGAFLALAAKQKGAPALPVDILTATFVASRVTFVASRFVGDSFKMAVGFPSMVVTYGAVAGLSMIVAFA